jgi:hypothetical protein
MLFMFRWVHNYQAINNHKNVLPGNQTTTSETLQAKSIFKIRYAG